MKNWMSMLSVIRQKERNPDDNILIICPNHDQIELKKRDLQDCLNWTLSKLQVSDFEFMVLGPAPEGPTVKLIIHG